MKDSQHALYERVSNFVASNGRADIVIGAWCVAVGAFWVGWAYRNQMSTWLATSLRVAGLLLAMMVLALQATFGGWMNGIDHSVTAWLVAHRNPLMDHLALGVTNGLGPVVTGGVAVVVAIAVAIRFRSALGGLTVFVTVGGASALSWLIKRLVGRSRPPMLIQETIDTDFSFPSGHVTGTAALFGILAVAVGLSGHRVATRLLTAFAVLAVSAVALSRLYLGVHWLTDVAAGALLAAAAVTIGAASLRSLVDRTAPVAEPALLVSTTKALQ